MSTSAARDAARKLRFRDGDELIVRREICRSPAATRSLSTTNSPPKHCCAICARFSSTSTGKANSRRFSIPTHIWSCSTVLPVTSRCGWRSPAAFARLSSLQRELAVCAKTAAENFQLVDTLQFQIGELERAQLSLGEDEQFGGGTPALGERREAHGALPVELQPDL